MINIKQLNIYVTTEWEWFCQGQSKFRRIRASEALGGQVKTGAGKSIIDLL